MKILGLSGSLRDNAFNTAILTFLKDQAPDGLEFEILHADLPLYDQDEDTDQGPEQVNAVKARLAQADAVIITSPEYNYSFSGVLKNTLDWLSRPAYNSGFKHKPVAMITASMADTGGIRAQEALRPVLSGMLAEVYPAPAAYIAAAHEKFNDDLVLTDGQTQERLKNYFEGFIAWVESS